MKNRPIPAPETFKEPRTVAVTYTIAVPQQHGKIARRFTEIVYNALSVAEAATIARHRAESRMGREVVILRFHGNGCGFSVTRPRASKASEEVAV